VDGREKEGNGSPLRFSSCSSTSVGPADEGRVSELPIAVFVLADSDGMSSCLYRYFSIRKRMGSMVRDDLLKRFSSSATFSASGVATHRTSTVRESAIDG